MPVKKCFSLKTKVQVEPIGSSIIRYSATQNEEAETDLTVTLVNASTSTNVETLGEIAVNKMSQNIDTETNGNCLNDSMFQDLQICNIQNCDTRNHNLQHCDPIE